MIRAIQKYDAAALLEFFRKLVASDWERVERPEDVQKITPAMEESWIDDRLEKEKTGELFARIVEVDGKIVAEGEVERLPRSMERHVAEIRFGVLPGHTDAAPELIHELENLAAKNGIEIIYYFHLATQKMGLELMRQAGFREAGRIPGLYKRGREYIDRIYLAKDLRG